MRRSPMRLVLLALLVTSFAFAAQPRPNVVLILADDMGWGDMGAYGGIIPTPHLDRLAAEGMRFTDAHTTSSVCTPTRYGILTGRYNWRSTLKSGVLHGTSKPLIKPGRPTLPGFLARRGYLTSVVGKWHLGLEWPLLDKPRSADQGPTKGQGWGIDYAGKVENGPLARGFTEDFLFPASLDMPPYVYLRNDKPVGIPTVTKVFKVPARPGPATADFEAVNCLGDFAREARGFIARASEASRPFFLYLPLTSPHTPLVPSPEWAGKSGMGDYADFVMETDWVVGEVLAELESTGQASSTLVFFTSDNGCSPTAGIPGLEARGHRPSGPWRGHKADIFEGGHRVPLLARWPGRIAPQTISDALVCTSDFFATVTDSLDLPLDPVEGVDSFSFLPAFEGKPVPRPFIIHHSVNGSFAVRRGPWKLILCPGSGGWSDPRPKDAWKAGLPPVQLYHLGDDPAERRNLFDSQPNRAKALADLLAEAIRRGRTTRGPALANEGWPDTIDNRVVELFPALKPPEK